MFGLSEAMMGFLRRQVGLRTDAADAGGSLHGKLKRLITDYTTARAGYLDKKISQSGIKSVQRGAAILKKESSNVSISISSVNMSKAFVVGSWRNIGDTTTPSKLYLSAQIASSNSLNIARGAYSEGYNDSTDMYFEWQVVEFY